LKAKQDGGKDHASNIVTAFYYCNQKRHNCKSPKDPISYKQYVTNRLEKGKWSLYMVIEHSNHFINMPTLKNAFTPTDTHSKASTKARVRFWER